MSETTNDNNGSWIDLMLRVFLVLLGLVMILGMRYGVIHGGFFEPLVITVTFMFGCLAFLQGIFYSSFKLDSIYSYSLSQNWHMALNMIIMIGGPIFWIVAEENPMFLGKLIAHTETVDIYLKSRNYKYGDEIKLIISVQGGDIIKSKITKVSIKFADSIDVVYQGDAPSWDKKISQNWDPPSRILVNWRMPLVSLTNCDVDLYVEYVKAKAYSRSYTGDVGFYYDTITDKINIPIKLLPEP